MCEEMVLPPAIHSNADTVLNNSTFSSSLSYLVNSLSQSAEVSTMSVKTLKNLMGPTQEGF